MRTDTKKKRKDLELWAVVHWLGNIVRYGTKKECTAWAKKNQMNPKAPIYYAVRCANSVKTIPCDKCSGEGALVILAD